MPKAGAKSSLQIGNDRGETISSWPHPESNTCWPGLLEQLHLNGDGCKIITMFKAVWEGIHINSLFYLAWNYYIMLYSVTGLNL